MEHGKVKWFNNEKVLGLLQLMAEMMSLFIFLRSKEMALSL